MSDQKRLRIDIPTVSTAGHGSFNSTVPVTPTGQGNVTAPVTTLTPTSSHSTPRRSPTGHTTPQLTPQEKVQRILERFPESYTEELSIPISTNSPSSLWEWFCASILFSARIKSNAGFQACKALFEAGLTSPETTQQKSKDEIKCILKNNGYDRYDEKTAGFIFENACTIVNQHKGDLNRLREAALHNPSQERTLLKKYKGIGDGGVDIFWREVQLVWDELYPFSDRKALKAARLVGLNANPQSLAELCGNDKLKYVRLIAGLVRIELTKTFHEYC